MTSPQVTENSGTVLSIRVSWAFSPLVLLLSLPVPLFLISISQPPKAYLNWGQPFFFTPDYVLLASVTLFILASVFAFNYKSRPTRHDIQLSSENVVRIITATNVIAVITIFAYLVWLIAGLARGLNFAILLEALNGSNGAIWRLKNEILAPISGITTWTQLGSTLGALAIIRWRVTGKRGIALFSLLFVATLFRAIFFLERLAMVELLVSCLIVFVATSLRDPISFRSKRNYLISLGAAYLLYVGFFAVTELIRSWTYYSSRSQLTLLQFSFERISAYYATSLNNAALYLDVNQYKWSPADLVQGNFEFGGSSSLLEQFGSGGMDKFASALFFRSNPEFNNISGILVTNSSLGVLGSWLLWIVLGLITCTLFNRASSGSLAALIAYPIFATGILEIVRLFYFGQSRVIPGLLCAAILSLYLWRGTADSNRLPRRNFSMS
jgi:hypothetical protein